MKLIREHTLTEYLGSRQAALAMTLFWLGAVCLLVTLIVGLQVLGSDEQAELWMLVVPTWGSIAAALGLALRTRSDSNLIFALAAFWLATAVLAFVVVRFSGWGN